MNVEFVLVHRIVEFPGRARDLRREEQEQHDVGDVHLPARVHSRLSAARNQPPATIGP